MTHTELLMFPPILFFLLSSPSQLMGLTPASSLSLIQSNKFILLCHQNTCPILTFSHHVHRLHLSLRHCHLTLQSPSNWTLPLLPSRLFFNIAFSNPFKREVRASHSPAQNPSNIGFCSKSSPSSSHSSMICLPLASLPTSPSTLSLLLQFSHLL